MFFYNLMPAKIIGSWRWNYANAAYKQFFKLILNDKQVNPA